MAQSNAKSSCYLYCFKQGKMRVLVGSPINYATEPYACIATILELELTFDKALKV